MHRIWRFISADWWKTQYLNWLPFRRQNLMHLFIYTLLERTKTLILHYQFLLKYIYKHFLNCLIILLHLHSFNYMAKKGLFHVLLIACILHTGSKSLLISLLVQLMGKLFQKETEASTLSRKIILLLYYTTLEEINLSHSCQKLMWSLVFFEMALIIISSINLKCVPYKADIKTLYTDCIYLI